MRLSGRMESPKKHPSLKRIILTLAYAGRQWKAGSFSGALDLLKCSGGVSRSASSGWKSERSRKGTSRL